MGSVWRAQHLELSALVAVKLIADGADNPDLAARLRREAKAAASLRSPHVVQILDYGVDTVTQLPFIVMELLDGESLAARLQRQGRIDLAETCRILGHVARALKLAHGAGIVHRDLKPDNIFLVRNDEEELAKVLDFGIAKANALAVGGDATATGTLFGTAYYMSPEQITGSRYVDWRSDLWALGVIAFECLTGSKPFVSDNLGALALEICTQPLPVPSRQHAVPPGFDDWFACALARVPGERFQSGKELVSALRALRSGSVPGLDRADTEPLQRGLAESFPAVHAAVDDPVDAQVAVVSGTAGPLSRTVPEGLPAPGLRGRSSRVVLGLFVAAMLGVGATALWPGGGDGSPDVPVVGKPGSADPASSLESPPVPSVAASSASDESPATVATSLVSATPASSPIPSVQSPPPPVREKHPRPPSAATRATPTVAPQPSSPSLIPTSRE